MVTKGGMYTYYHIHKRSQCKHLFSSHKRYSHKRPECKHYSHKRHIITDPPEELDQFGALDELGHVTELLEEAYEKLNKEMSDDLKQAIEYIWENIEDSYGGGELCVLLYEYQKFLYDNLDTGYYPPPLNKVDDVKMWLEKTEEFLVKVDQEGYI